jgi:hypothetical protein
MVRFADPDPEVEHVFFKLTTGTAKDKRKPREGGSGRSNLEILFCHQKRVPVKRKKRQLMQANYTGTYGDKKHYRYPTQYVT